MKVESGESSGRADLSKRLAVVSREVGGDTGGFAYDGDAPGVGGGIACVLVGGLRVVVQQALSHHQVAGDVLGIGASQGTKLALCAPLEVARFDVVGNIGLRGALALRRATSTLVLPVPGASASGAAVETPRFVITADWASFVRVSVPTALCAPVIPPSVLCAGPALIADAALGTPPPIVRVAAPTGVMAATRTVVPVIEALASTEAVTVTVPTMPGRVAVVRMVPTVLIRHGPTFDPGLPSVPLPFLNAWEEPTRSAGKCRNGARSDGCGAWRVGEDIRGVGVFWGLVVGGDR